MPSSMANGALIKSGGVPGLFIRTTACLALGDLAAHFAGREQPTPVV
jgi:hypothetical protein